MLHAPVYRAIFAVFLKIDFPRVPYPASPEVFARVSAKGEQLRGLHPMERTAIGDTPDPFTGEGDDVVAPGFPKFDDRVSTNPDQGFDTVPAIAWGFTSAAISPRRNGRRSGTGANELIR